MKSQPDKDEMAGTPAKGMSVKQLETSGRFPLSGILLNPKV
jgi:hypothetical protein